MVNKEKQTEQVVEQDAGDSEKNTTDAGQPDVEHTEIPDSKEVHTYSLIEALQSLQEAVLDGYILDVETNSGYPQQFGTHYILTFVRPTAKKEPKAKNSAFKTKGR